MRYQTAYTNISYRHLDMAEILEKEGYYEGAVFHAYHAFETICRAGLGETFDYPMEHAQILRLFIFPYPNGNIKQKLSQTFDYLGSLTGRKDSPDSTRNKALYYIDKIEPHKRFQADAARTAIKRVDEVVKLIISRLN